MSVSTTPTIPTDADFEVLAHRLRRAVLRYPGDVDVTPTGGQLIETLPAQKRAESKPDDLRSRLPELIEKQLWWGS